MTESNSPKEERLIPSAEETREHLKARRAEANKKAAAVLSSADYLFRVAEMLEQKQEK